ncbi:MAG: hypothetical protein FJZ58_06565 [Chlamydiae bacterium]|nr:hypothetical protein [Chlamydiota bacterium]
MNSFSSMSGIDSGIPLLRPVPHHRIPGQNTTTTQMTQKAYQKVSSDNSSVGQVRSYSSLGSRITSPSGQEEVVKRIRKSPGGDLENMRKNLSLYQSMVGSTLEISCCRILEYLLAIEGERHISSSVLVLIILLEQPDSQAKQEALSHVKHVIAATTEFDAKILNSQLNPLTFQPTTKSIFVTKERLVEDLALAYWIDKHFCEDLIRKEGQQGRDVQFSHPVKWALFVLSLPPIGPSMKERLSKLQYTLLPFSPLGSITKLLEELWLYGFSSIERAYARELEVATSLLALLHETPHSQEKTEIIEHLKTLCISRIPTLPLEGLLSRCGFAKGLFEGSVPQVLLSQVAQSALQRTLQRCRSCSSLESKKKEVFTMLAEYQRMITLLVSFSFAKSAELFLQESIQIPSFDQEGHVIFSILQEIVEEQGNWSQDVKKELLENVLQKAQKEPSYARWIVLQYLSEDLASLAEKEELKPQELHSKLSQQVIQAMLALRGEPLVKHIDLYALLCKVSKEEAVASLCKALLQKPQITEQEYLLAKALLQFVKADQLSAIIPLLVGNDVYTLLLRARLGCKEMMIPLTQSVALARQVAKELGEEFLEKELSFAQVAGRNEVLLCHQLSCVGTLWGSLLKVLLEQEMFSDKISTLIKEILRTYQLAQDPVEGKRCKNYFKESLRKSMMQGQQAFASLEKKLRLAQLFSEELYIELLEILHKDFLGSVFFAAYSNHKQIVKPPCAVGEQKIVICNEMTVEQIAQIPTLFTQGKRWKEPILQGLAALTDQTKKERLALSLIATLTSEKQLEGLSYVGGKSLLVSMCEGAGVSYQGKEIPAIHRILALAWHPDKVSEDKKELATQFIQGITPLKEFILGHQQHRLSTL